MPDWFHWTLSRPALFLLPTKVSRNLALGLMVRLARLPCAAGLVYLLVPLWGLRRGAAWLWHTFRWSGLAACTAAIGVRYAVGYIDLRHLLPAFAGLGLLLCGLVCSFAWCHQRETTLRP